MKELEKQAWHEMIYSDVNAVYWSDVVKDREYRKILKRLLRNKKAREKRGKTK